MTKQLFFSPDNSVRKQVLKTIWHWSKIHKEDLCFGIVIYTKDTVDSIAHKLADCTQLACAILCSSSFTQSERWFFELQSFGCVVFWSYFLFCRVEQPSVLTLLLELMLPKQWKHCTLPGTIISNLSVPIFHLRFVDKHNPLAKGDKLHSQHFSNSTITANIVWTYSAFNAVCIYWETIACITRYCIKRNLSRLTEAQRALIFNHSQEIWLLWRTS